MSGSVTPTGGGYMRQRHSQGYASSGDDLEDDACSRSHPTSPAGPRNRTWIEILENFLWLASAVFIIYYGDRRSNLIYLLLHDDRIRRINGGLTRLRSHVRMDESSYILYIFTGLSLCGQELFTAQWHCLVSFIGESRTPLYLGMVGVGLNILIFFYSSMSIWSVRRFDEKWELTSISVLPLVTLLGLVSFCLLCFALWPIWSFLSLPLLFTLFMVGMVIFPQILIGTFRPQYDMFRVD